jgi:hypothetical protein
MLSVPAEYEVRMGVHKAGRHKVPFRVYNKRCGIGVFGKFLVRRYFFNDTVLDEYSRVFKFAVYALRFAALSLIACRRLDDSYVFYQ